MSSSRARQVPCSTMKSISSYSSFSSPRVHLHNLGRGEDQHADEKASAANPTLHIDGRTTSTTMSHRKKHVIDTTATERACHSLLRRPLDATHSTWHDDPGTYRPIQGDKPFADLSDKCSSMNNSISAPPFRVFHAATRPSSSQCRSPHRAFPRHMFTIRKTKRIPERKIIQSRRSLAAFSSRAIHQSFMKSCEVSISSGRREIYRRHIPTRSSSTAKRNRASGCPSVICAAKYRARKISASAITSTAT